MAEELWCILLGSMGDGAIGWIAVMIVVGSNVKDSDIAEATK